MLFKYYYFFLFSFILYDRYLLEKQIKNLRLTNTELLSNLEILNQKYLQLETSLVGLKTANHLSHTSNVFGINDLSNLEFNLSSLGVVLVVTVLAASSGWFVGKLFYSSFLFKSFPVIFLKSTLLRIAYVDIPVVMLNKYDVKSEMNFSTHTAEHFIKKCTETEYTPLAEFISEMLQADISTANLLENLF